MLLSRYDRWRRCEAAILSLTPPQSPPVAHPLLMLEATIVDLVFTISLIGTTGFARYFGAKFGEDFVAFENIRYGNAIYIMRENWQTLSQKSRIELMTGRYEEVIRIEHRRGWGARLSSYVRAYRQDKAKKLL